MLKDCPRYTFGVGWGLMGIANKRWPRRSYSTGVKVHHPLILPSSFSPVSQFISSLLHIFSIYCSIFQDHTKEPKYGRWKQYNQETSTWFYTVRSISWSKRALNTWSQESNTDASFQEASKEDIILLLNKSTEIDGNLSPKRIVTTLRDWRARWEYCLHWAHSHGSDPEFSKGVHVIVWRFLM